MNLDVVEIYTQLSVWTMDDVGRVLASGKLVLQKSSAFLKLDQSGRLTFPLFLNVIFSLFVCSAAKAIEAAKIDLFQTDFLKARTNTNDFYFFGMKSVKTRFRKTN